MVALPGERRRLLYLSGEQTGQAAWLNSQSSILAGRATANRLERVLYKYIPCADVHERSSGNPRPRSKVFFCLIV